MKFLLVSLIVALLTAETFGAKTLRQFSAFKKQFNKIYASQEEEAFRQSVFIKNIQKIKALNLETRQRGSGATFGINKFSDLSEEEFSAKFKLATPLQTVSQAEALKIRAEKLNEDAATKAVGAPAVLDWRKKAPFPVTAVKNQGQCGSCWAFSATESVESVNIMAGNAANTVALAPQQIVDCDTTSMGCGGGEPSSAYNYLIQAGGQESEAAYPYHAVNQQCAFNASDVRLRIASWKKATSWYSESTLHSNLAAWGPLSICVDAANWQHYKSGVMDRFQCAVVNRLDHCVQLVGIALNATTPYWQVRNSWGTGWGLSGYIRLEYGWDVCGIANQATTPVV